MDAFDSIINIAYQKLIPLYVHWELTYRCNLKCKHCYIDNPSDVELNLFDIERILDELKDAGALFIVFTGGEVFMREDILEILKAARDRKFAITVFTNGSLLDERVVKIMADIGVKDIEVSIYGVNNFTHDNVTGVKGSLNKTKAGIEIAASYGIRIKVKTMILKQNMDEFKNIWQWCKDKGFEFSFDYIFVNSDRNRNIMKEVGMNEDEIVSFLRANFDLSDRGEDRDFVVEPAGCGVGRITCGISPAGDVFPCLSVREKSGNLRERSFKEIWYGIALDKWRRKTYYCNRIKTCEYARFCSYCPGEVLQERKDINSPYEISCMCARAQKRAMRKGGN